MTREGYDMEDATRRFTAIDNRNETREILSSVYDSLKVKGYNPINQLVGYIISEDPTYITNYNNARSLICRLDRDELLQELLVLPREVKNQKRLRQLSLPEPFFTSRLRLGLFPRWQAAPSRWTPLEVSAHVGRLLMLTPCAGRRSRF